MPAAGQQGPEVASLDLRRAERFFDQLASNPFIAIVVDGEKVHFYARADIDSEHLERIKRSIERLIEESD